MGKVAFRFGAAVGLVASGVVAAVASLHFPLDENAPDIKKPDIKKDALTAPAALSSPTQSDISLTLSHNFQPITPPSFTGYTASPFLASLSPRLDIDTSEAAPLIPPSPPPIPLEIIGDKPAPTNTEVNYAPTEAPKPVRKPAVPKNTRIYPDIKRDWGAQYVVIDANTGEIILGKAENQLRQPASLTKLMTLALVFEAIQKPDTTFNPNSRVTVPSYIRKVPRGIAKFEKMKVGKAYKVENLIIGAGSRSDAYSTLTLALHLGSKNVYNWGGSDRDKASRFIREMNKKAKEIGMKNTNFSVMTGLPHAENMSTPYDIALLMKHLQDNYPKLSETALGQPRFNISEISASTKHTSRLLRAKPELIDFAKTGWTKAAGFALAAFSEVNDRPVIAVILGIKGNQESGRKRRNALMTNILEHVPR